MGKRGQFCFCTSSPSIFAISVKIMAVNSAIFSTLLLVIAGVSAGVVRDDVEPTGAPVPPSDAIDPTQKEQGMMSIVNKMNETITSIREAQNPDSLIDRTVRINLLNSLFLMANASALAGTRTSLAAGALIRGFVQDSFNLVSIGAYLPRLIFLDGPTQFIEVLRLFRSGQIHIPRDIDEAMDTLINFASVVRDSQIQMNLATPFLSFFPNVFRGAELLSTEVLYGVFSWLTPLGPAEISAASVEGLWNRWDVKSSTTARAPARQTLHTI